ncbi:MAG: sensor histidine kinase [Actinomycetota bacterium]
MEATATLGRPATDADECRRLAELLNLDAVGVVRSEGGRRRVAWWASPGTEVMPLERILDGSASGWIAFPRGEDLVFAHLSDGAPGRSVATLTAMLTSLAGVETVTAAVELGGVAPEDPIERDRARLAYAIHDGLTQVVTASILELEWHARRADAEPGDATEALLMAAAELRKALQEIRGVLASLTVQGGGTMQSLEELIQGVMERWQLPARWSVEGDLQDVPKPVMDVATSVIRESVANAAKHAASNEIAVTVHASENGVEVNIEDKGKGFHPNGTGIHAGHLGLEMMRRRVAELDGTLDIESSPGKGTRVVARLPVPEQGAKP